MNKRLMVEFLGMDFLSGPAQSAARSVRELERIARSSNSQVVESYQQLARGVSESTKQWAREVVTQAELAGRRQIDIAEATARELLSIQQANNRVQLEEFKANQRQQLADFKVMLNEQLNEEKLKGAERIAVRNEVTNQFKLQQAREVSDFRLSLEQEVNAQRSANAEMLASTRARVDGQISASRMYVNTAMDQERALNESRLIAARQTSQSAHDWGQQMIGSGTMAVISGAMILGATAAFDTFFVHAGMAFGQFSSDMVLLVNHANVAKDQIPIISQSLRDMAVGVAIGPDALAQAMFRVESHMTSLPSFMQNTASALDILTNSARLSKIGHADLEQTTIALTNVLAAYGQMNYTAAQAAGILNRAVGEGNMRLEDLIVGFSTGLLPVAQQAGVRLESLTAAMATMTDMGVPVSRAATYIRSALIQMTMPSNAAEDALTAIGLGAEEAGHRMAGFSELLEKAGINQTQLTGKLREHGSLAETLTFLKQKLHDAGATATETDAILSRAFGGIRSGTGVVTLYNNLNGLVTKEKDATEAAKSFGDVWDYYTQNDPTYRLDQLRAVMTDVQVSIGQAVVPAILGLVAVLIPFLDDLRHWIDSHQELVRQFFVFGTAAGVVIGILTILAGLVMVVGGVIAVLGGPFALIAAVMVAGVLLILTHWQMFHGWMVNTFGPMWQRAKGEIDNFVRAGEIIFKYLVPNLQEGFRQIWEAMNRPSGTGLQDAFDQINTFVHSWAMAQILAFFAVMLPSVIQISIKFLIVWIDYVKTVMDAMGHVIAATMLMAQGKTTEAMVEMAKAAIDFNKDASQALHDFGEATKTADQAGHTMAQSFDQATRDMFIAINGLTMETNSKLDEMPGMVQKHMLAMQAAAKAQKPGFKDAGKQLGDGIAEGIDWAVGDIKDAAVRAIVAAKMAANEAAITQSPSQLMKYEVGVPLAQGIAAGIDAGTVYVQHAMSNVIGGSMSGDFNIPMPYDLLDNTTTATDNTYAPSSGSSGSWDDSRIVGVLTNIDNRLADIAVILQQEGASDQRSSASLMQIYRAQEEARSQRSRGVVGS